MKYLLPPFLLLITISSAGYAQQRPRVFETYDTSNFAVIPSTPPKVTEPKAPAAKTANSRPRVVPNLYPPSPPYGQQYKNVSWNGGTINGQLIQRTVQATQRVDEGYADAGRSTQFRNPTYAGEMHLRGYSTGDAAVDSFIVDSSKRYRVDPLLIYAQMAQESSFKKRATSYKGASGLMQLMPATARRLGVSNIYDPQQNIEGGVKYMRILLDMFDQDLDLALAGYNAGEGAVIKYGYQIPPYAETQDYVRRISSRYRSMTDIAKNSRPTQR
ncbi:MAG: lytic transglycosylase domain-containing protein [Pyrinomonadaceae bacterium]